jgi:hypothetical protein
MGCNVTHTYVLASAPISVVEIKKDIVLTIISVDFACKKIAYNSPFESNEYLWTGH